MDARTDTRSLVTGQAANAADLEAELNWLADVVDKRLQRYFAGEGKQDFDFYSLPPPDLTASTSSYARFLIANHLSAEERLLLILALVPYIRPQLLDVFFARNSLIERGFSEFGGVQGSQHGGFLPTAETALFIVAGDSLEARFKTMQLFDTLSVLFADGVLKVAPANAMEPWSSGVLQIAKEFVDQFTTGADYHPGYSVDFPARRIHTGLLWEHLILPATTMEQLEEIRNWILHGQRLLIDWGMQDKLSPGFTSLFYGPPGTGKTLSACLLGKYCGCDVYKVDLSLMVSKYIGETEKNLARVFDAAENRGWILFFDEADALFGKRTKVDDSHDRYANQEVSFLLQRIEEFNGVVILASNFKTNIDDAFIRRFQSVVHFPMPKPAERHKIWKNAFSPKGRLEAELNLQQLADKHDVSGGTIMNVVRFASLRAISRGGETILKEDVDEGLRREYIKEGRRL